MKRPLYSFFQSSWSIVAAIIKVIILHCVESFEAGLWAHYNSTNSTGVGDLILNVHLTCGSGVMTDEVMEIPDVRDGYWNLTKKKKSKKIHCLS